MKSQATSLIRRDLQGFRAFQERTFGKKGIFLNANESPWGEYNRYPNAISSTIIDTLSKIYRVKASQLILTRGSDEGIDYILRLFCQAQQDEVIICPPTFDMYAYYAQLQGAVIKAVPLTEKSFSYDLNKIKNSVTTKTKIIFLCSPNNPTGTTIAPKDIFNLAQAIKNQAIVVVDEAYIEFSHNISMVAYLRQLNNLIILRTLSKAYGLAGLRCGVIIAQSTLIDSIKRIMPPYRFSQMVLNYLEKSMMGNTVKHLARQLDYIQEQKIKLNQSLLKLPIVKKTWCGGGNYILVQFQSAKKVLLHCINAQIYVRDLSFKPELKNCIRITIGTDAQNKRLLTMLKKVV